MNTDSNNIFFERWQMAGKPNFVVAWWSAGITSAVACKMALELYENVEIVYIGIKSAHPDNDRFAKECEEWYGQPIHYISSKKYLDQFEVIEDTGYVNGAAGARCTKELKKEVRFQLERNFEINLFNRTTILNQVWGFEYSAKEVNRAIRHGQQYPNTNPLFPLIEKGLDKNTCAGLLQNAGIELPEMYKLGYSNNNCIGCVKGGMGYWNKIRVDFPETFNKMAKLEREVGHSCIHNEDEGSVYLDELDPKRGRMSKEIMPSCGVVCEVEFADIPDKSLESVMNGTKTIYEAIEGRKKNIITDKENEACGL